MHILTNDLVNMVKDCTDDYWYYHKKHITSEFKYKEILSGMLMIVSNMIKFNINGVIKEKFNSRYDIDIAEFKGKTFTECFTNGDDKLFFVEDNGQEYKMYHNQDCCESVYIEDICGDLNDLIGTPILEARQSSSNDTPKDVTQEYEPESQTWTFYTLRTIKGSVDIRWFGSSNGYYSERVTLTEI